MRNQYAFRFVEHEIYRYYEIKEAVQELEDDIILSTREQNEIKGTDASDTVGESVIMLHRDPRIHHLKRTVTCIDIAWLNLDDTQRRILEYKYWKHSTTTWEDVAALHYVAVRTLYNWRSSVVKEVGIRLGVM
jgi:RinA family phage transcriptional activator